MIALGLDIGTNSVGSAWVDTETREIAVGVSVFPAGVDETDDKRGAPKNQERRAKRSLRRNLARRSERKRRTRRVLAAAGFFPRDAETLKKLLDLDPWELRRKGLNEQLEPLEFGRVVLHLAQRRGSVGFDADIDSEGKIKQAMTRLHQTMMIRFGSEQERRTAEDLNQHIEALRKKLTKKAEGKELAEADDQARPKNLRQEYDAACDELQALCRKVMESHSVTFGRFIADLRDERRHVLTDVEGQPKASARGGVSHYFDPIRNGPDRFEFHADRAMIRDEFDRLWKRQCEPGGALSKLDPPARDRLRKQLDDPTPDSKWRHQGALFGQRVTYWNTSTLGRCDLEPTERCAPIADRHASFFRVVETVNNIRIQGPLDRQPRPLTEEERRKVIDRLRSRKTGSVAAVREALGIDKRSLKKQDLPEKSWKLSLEQDEDREINTDWFHREIVVKGVGAAMWNQWNENQREGLNRAILKCDPAAGEDGRLRDIARKIGLDDAAIDRLIAAWKTRPKLEKRLSLSRGAIIHLLPYMERALPDRRWPTQIEARQLFASDRHNAATAEQRTRYAIGAKSLTKADRHYMKKHAGELPPAPMLSNPVVRKAIHEVRRHVLAHVRAHGGRKPDRIVIEFAREAKKPKKQADWMLALNRKRERIRKAIEEDVVKPAWGNSFHTLSHNQLQEAIDRVVLSRQQKGDCAYSGTQPDAQRIDEFTAARGTGLEIDHIVPKAIGGGDAWSNRVLCWEKSNRDKGKRTPRQWWDSEFDKLSRPMAFMASHEPAKGDPNEYFTKRDYAAKWENFSRSDAPEGWRGSQLTDTAYAARQVQSYLQSAIWPGEPSHLEGGQRRIFVTIGSYTHQLRKDWQLFQTLLKPSESSPEAVRNASLKNRGDHREHAIDAVAIAFTAIPADESQEKDEHGHVRTRIQDLAKHQQEKAERRLQVKLGNREKSPDDRKPLPPPWGDVQSFRRQVMSLVFADFEGSGATPADGNIGASPEPIVVAHRPIGRRITGSFHEDTLFGPVPEMDNAYVGRKSVLQLSPAHLRLPKPESQADSIKRLTEDYLKQGLARTKREAAALAKKTVAAPGFDPPLVDPAPEKSGLVRDLDLRRRLRTCIATFEYIEKDRDGNVKKQYLLDPDSFSDKELKQAVEAGAIKHASGVPIKRVKLLRTMVDPVVVPRQRWDQERGRWVRDTGKDGDLTPDQRSRADRAYVGGNNHHIEIREDAKGKWTGKIVTMFEAATRVRKQKRDAVDRSDDPERGGRFVMSLSAGETLCMVDEDTGKLAYFVVFKLVKPNKVQFMHQWDARRAKGEKDASGTLLPNSTRIPVGKSANQLRELAPPGYDFPFKVRVGPLGDVTPLERD